MGMLMMKMNTKWRNLASCLLVCITTAMALPTLAVPLNSFDADYVVYRAGKKHGEAKRYLKQTELGYDFGYSSDISWLIFSDKRSETSEFIISDQQIHPSRYVMERTGTGPDRHYEWRLDHQLKALSTGKKKQPKALVWHDNLLDPISYQLQLVLDLKAGKTDFFYQVLNRNGDLREYQYKVVGEELLALPYGNINTIRIARVEEADSEKQIYAWVAPELDYMLVRLWRGEDNVEQFDVLLKSLSMEIPEAEPLAVPDQATDTL